MKRLALAALLLAATASAQAQLYKCVDAQGRVSYSDKARPGCEATRIRGAKPPAPKAAPAGAARSAPPASKAGKAATGPAAARPQSEAAPAPQRSDAQQALHCRGLRQERAWLAGPRGEGVPARDERLGQLEQALRDCP